MHTHTHRCAHAHAHMPLPAPVPCPQLWLLLLGTMTFSKIVDSVNGQGPFQFLIMVLLGLPILGMANHNLLQIFTATTPAHHCRPPPNASAGPWVLPMGRNGKPESCLRFMHPPNASLPNDTRGATEPCRDGWAYDLSARDSIVTEVCPEAARAPLRAAPTPRSTHRQGAGRAQCPEAAGTGRWTGREGGLGYRCAPTKSFGFFTLRALAFLQAAHCVHGAQG